MMVCDTFLCGKVKMSATEYLKTWGWEEEKEEEEKSGKSEDFCF